MVTAESEWCAEAYMETDYQLLTDDSFIKKLAEYSTFLFFNRLRNSVSNDRAEKRVMALDTTSWHYFELPRLFNVGSTRDELMNKLTPGTQTPYITSSELNNGVTSYVDDISNFGERTITANRGGSVGFFFYQPMNYMATPVDVRVLTPNFEINPCYGIFLATVLQLEKYRFNYSRKMGTDRLKNLRIKLPVRDNEPDWEYIEAYIKSLPYSTNLE
jgi:hypothetical protein